MDEHQIEPVTFERLKPLPLPRELAALPKKAIDEFIQLHEIVAGYLKSLDSYKEVKDEIVGQINHQISQINEISKILEEYDTNGLVIHQQVERISRLYQEFQNLEVYQYQLLSANFNREFLKKKYEKLIQESEQESMQVADQVKLSSQGAESNFIDTLNQFRESRKHYHLHKEKLNRWNEERVSGLT